ncbi:MAG: hypothetical protein ACLFS1_11550 [Opitutales bacterium]
MILPESPRRAFDGGMNNAKYQKMTVIGDRTALRDLNDLGQRGLMVKTGQTEGHPLSLECASPGKTVGALADLMRLRLTRTARTCIRSNKFFI